MVAIFDLPLTPMSESPESVHTSGLAAAILTLSFSFTSISTGGNGSYSSIHGGRVAKALACNARGDGFAPHLRRYFRDLLSRIDTVYGTEGLKMVCVALTVPCNVSGDNW